MNNVAGNQKMHTKLNDSDRKVLSKYRNDYIETSENSSKCNSVNPQFNNTNSNIHDKSL